MFEDDALPGRIMTLEQYLVEFYIWHEEWRYTVAELPLSIVIISNYHLGTNHRLLINWHEHQIIMQKNVNSIANVVSRKRHQKCIAKNAKK